ncbi:glycosyltransferase [Vagococcus lutrae]|uniref:glycosyltransferase n=1 Tax=Vagococcus lutrae TaxID=81947 RepID=UPI00200CD4A5|nr:glycosyltransferase [Vagococcus lutrae]UQF18027.1 glycosyltransferase [Vagococcus lutrae]
MKTICFVINSLGTGGAERMLLKLVKSTSENYNYQIITLLNNHDLSSEISHLDIPIVSLDIKKRKGIIKRTKKVIGILSESDLIHSWLYHSDLFSFIFGKILLKKKIIWNIRHTNLSKKHNKKSTLLLVKINSILSKYVDKIVYCSHSSYNSHKVAGYKNGNSFVIPNGFDVKRFNLIPKNNIFKELRLDFPVKNNQKILLTIGRYHSLKGYDILMESMAQWKDENFLLLMVGRNIDDNNQELKEYIRKANVNFEKIKLLGERNDVEKLLSIADLFILSSISEGFPNVLGEAVFSKVFSITTDAGDAGYILKNKDWIVPCENPKSLGLKIKNYFSLSESERDSIINENYKFVKNNYEMSIVSSRYNEIHSDII